MTVKSTKRKAITTLSDDAMDDEDFIACMAYVQHCELAHNTKQSFADLQHIAISTLWQWTIKWRQNGLLKKVRQIVWLGISEDATLAYSQAAQDWSSLMKEWKRLALHSKSDFVRFQAILAFHEKIMVPMMADEVDTGATENDYLDMIIRSPRALNPLSVAGSEAPGAGDPEPELPEPSAAATT